MIDDLRSRKTGINDPDMGVWSYSYNVLAELITQADAKHQVTTNTFGNNVSERV